MHSLKTSIRFAFLSLSLFLPALLISSTCFSAFCCRCCCFFLPQKVHSFYLFIILLIFKLKQTMLCKRLQLKQKTLKVYFIGCVFACTQTESEHTLSWIFDQKCPFFPNLKTKYSKKLSDFL